MKIVGYKRTDFVTKDGKEITGYSVYTEEPVVGTDAKGYQGNHFFLTDEKIERMGITLDELLDEEVTILYNRFGKPAQIYAVR